MSEENHISLKEHFNKIIDNLEEKFDEYKQSSERALALQSKETERRLAELNGEAGRIKAFQGASVTKEVHERDVKELRNLINVLTLANTKNVTQDQLQAQLKTPGEDIRILTSSKDIQTGRSLQSTVTIALVFSIISAVGGLIGIIAFLRTL